MMSVDARACRNCGAIFNRTWVVPAGIAVMMAIAVLYALFERYW
jgi:hypothetical protein